MPVHMTNYNSKNCSISDVKRFKVCDVCEQMDGQSAKVHCSQSIVWSMLNSSKTLTLHGNC